MDTREETEKPVGLETIQKLTDLELDAEIAKQIFEKDIYIRLIPIESTSPLDYPPEEKYSLHYEDDYDENGEREIVPSFSTEIQAAWILMDWMGQNGLDPLTSSVAGRKWSASFKFGLDKRYSVINKIPSRAISEAALLAYQKRSGDIEDDND